MQDNWLNQIHIVLIETTLPANIGAVARAMKTMGMQHLHLVNPKHPLNDDAFARASNATDILKQAKYHTNIKTALNNSQMVLAASGRQRSLPIPFTSLKTATEIMWQHIKTVNQANKTHDWQQTENKICILFGREDRGLTNDELALANYHVGIPANEAYGVLNLAAAVQVFCYEIRQTFIKPNALSESSNELLIRTNWDEPPAKHEQIHQLEDEILKLAEKVGIYNPLHPRSTPKRLKRLLNRLQIDRMEYNFLRAIITKSNQKID